MSMEVNELIGKVAERNGIRLDPTDPAFALVTLNELVLRQVSAELREQFDGLIARFAEEVRRLDARSSAVLLQEARLAGEAIRTELGKDIRGASLRARELVQQASRANAATRAWMWAAVGATSGLVLFGLGFWLGRVNAACP